MKARKSVLVILVGVAGAAGGNAFAATSPDGTVVHSRPPDECYAAMTRDWSKLAQLKGKEDPASEPVVVVTQAQGTRKD